MQGGTILGGRLVWVVALLGGASLLGATVGGYLWGVRSASGTHLLAAKDGNALEVASRERASERDATSSRAPHDALVKAAVAAAPVAQEPDARSLSPEEARDREVDRIKASGLDRRNLVVDARRVGRDWSQAILAKKLDVTFDDWRCYRAGCLVNARHGSSAALDGATDEITRSRGFAHWNGGKFRSGPIETDKGETEATWILFAPAEDERALEDYP